MTGRRGDGPLSRRRRRRNEDRVRADRRRRSRAGPRDGAERRTTSTTASTLVERVLRRRASARSASRPASTPPTSTRRSSGCRATARSAATSPRLDAVPARRPRARPLQLRQRHGVRLGRVAGRRRRHQRHQRHRVDDLRRAAGDRARVGGWGELFGDEGSAYWIAVQGLNAFTRMSDGRARPRPAATTCCGAPRARRRPRRRQPGAQPWQGSRAAIAALATTACARPPQAGDDAAARILADGGRRAGRAGRHHPRAGRFHRRRDRAGVLLRRDVRRRRTCATASRAALGALPATYDLRGRCSTRPSGAALYAAKHSGHPLSATAVKQLAGAATTSEKVTTP